jgi:uncharacterized membrane protein YedE/YeeE
VTRVRAISLAFGAAFGFVISWGQFTDPDRIRDMLLLRDPYLYLMMASAVALAFVGTQLLRRRHFRALVTGKPVTVERAGPERRHLAGAVIFGVGWAIADACPAPVAAQVTQGVAWSLFTLTGMLLGIAGYLRWREGPAPAVRSRGVVTRRPQWRTEP